MPKKGDIEMKTMITFIYVLIICSFCGHFFPSEAGQNNQPSQVNSSKTSLSTDSTDLSKMELKQAFKELKKSEFVGNKPHMDESVKKAFGYREDQALDLACKEIKLPIRKNVNGKTISRGTDFFVAKSIVQNFPDRGIDRLSDLYDSTNDPTVRGNIIMVLGGMENNSIMWALLMKALDNKDNYPETDPEAIGIPLRVCDLAYNQIVAKYEINDVLRTIGTGHAIDVRDYHIENLKKLISD